MKFLMLILCLAALPLSAAALEIPKGGEFDARVKFIDYNPAEVVGVTAHYGYSTHIEFAPGESILKIGMGDRQAWDIGKLGNHLFVKPVGDQAGTNMTVLTDKRVYNFELSAHASKRGARPKPNDMFFQVKFRYPEDEALQAQAIAKNNTLQNRLNQHDENAPQNWNYWVKEIGRASCWEREYI